MTGHDRAGVRPKADGDFDDRSGREKTAVVVLGLAQSIDGNLRSGTHSPREHQAHGFDAELILLGRAYCDADVAALGVVDRK